MWNKENGDYKVGAESSQKTEKRTKLKWENSKTYAAIQSRMIKILTVKWESFALFFIFKIF